MCSMKDPDVQEQMYRLSTQVTHWVNFLGMAGNRNAIEESRVRAGRG